MINFKHICACLSARHCWESGVAVKEIARQAGQTPSTIHEWITTAYGGNPYLKASRKGKEKT